MEKPTIGSKNYIDRALISVLKSEEGIGVGISVTRIEGESETDVYIGSIYISEETGLKPCFINAMQLIEQEYGSIPEVVRTNVAFYRYSQHVRVAKRKLGVENMAVKVYNHSKLGQASELAEDAIKRKTTITELIGERAEISK
ncbi:hypothetical protein [Terribacillus saccharophilus]|uniref:hypothetical protein n=1 Tax=Terribacillus saccharophilus TaxID=361277 RepID=UPI003982D52A